MYITLSIDGAGACAAVVAKIEAQHPSQKADLGLLSMAAPPYDLCYFIGGGADVSKADCAEAQAAIADLLTELVPVSRPNHEAIHTKKGREQAAQAALDRLIAAVR